jgi:hypothetical protein
MFNPSLHQTSIPFRPSENTKTEMSTTSNASSTPSSDDTTDLLVTTPVELSRMILEPGMPRILTNAFAPDPTSLAMLRHYYFLSESQRVLRQQIARHNTERSELFQSLMGRREFQIFMFPVLNEYRTIHSSLPPYDQHSPAVDNPHSFGNPPPPLVENPPTSPSAPTSNDDNTSSSTDEARTVEITPMDTIDEEESTSSEDSMISFYTRDEETRSGLAVTFYTANSEPGSQQNPIDVDRLFVRTDTPHPAIHILRRTRSNPINDRQTTRLTSNSESSLPLSYCKICGLHGHLPDGCLRMGPFVCTYCREIGHEFPDCVERRRDEAKYHPELQFCLICGQPGHSLNQCLTLQYPSQ